MRLAHPLIPLAVVAGTAALIATLPSVHAPTASAAPSASPYGESVTVLAPEVVRVRVGRGRHNQPVEVASLALKVSYSDLDLKKASDQKVFKDRIMTTAREACRKLDAQTPLQIMQPPVNTPCIGDASTQALKVADEVIAAANQA